MSESEEYYGNLTEVRTKVGNTKFRDGEMRLEIWRDGSWTLTNERGTTLAIGDRHCRTPIMYNEKMDLTTGNMTFSPATTVKGSPDEEIAAKMADDVSGKMKDPNYKFSEDVLLEDLRVYINNTYKGHYNKNKFQASEFIIDSGHGMGMFLGNVLKYAQRYGHKNGKERKDLMKVLHYAIMAVHVHDLEQGDTE